MNRFFSTQKKSVLLNNRGMTLIEILVVLFIVAGLITITASPRSNQKYISRNEVTKLKTLFRQTQNTSRLNNTVYRIKFLLNIEDEDGQAIQQSYLVEKKSEPTEANIIEEEDEDKPPSDGFELATNITKKPRPLPRPLIISHVEIKGVKDKIEDDEAYIYFSPNGSITEAIISIDVGLPKNWSLVTHPFIAELNLIKEDIDLEDINKEL